jgi:hypothetical protein
MRGRRIKASDQSYGQLQAKLLVALQSARGSSCYINDVWDDHVVFTQWSDLSPSTTWSVPYAITDGTVTFGDVTKVEPVTSYVAIKRVGPDTVEGLAIPFGGIFAGKDFDGEDFGSDTDFCLDWFGTSGRPVLYDHGLDRSVKSAVAGRQIEHEVREEGIWAQAQLDRATKFRRAIDRLIDEEALGWSSGAMSHLVTKSTAGHITRWPWVELSMTPIPAAGPLSTVHYVKSASFIDYLTEAGADVPAPLVAAALKALDDHTDDEGALPDGTPLPDLLDRLTVEAGPWVGARKSWHAKSGRVLSAATRDRLAAHPSALRQLADDLDALLADADAPKDTGKRASAWELELEAERARAFGVPI